MLATETKVATEEVVGAPNINAHCSWKEIVEPVEPFLRAVTQQLLQQAREFDPQLVPYAEHALHNSGKHLRPTLVALAAGSLGKVGDAHVTAAVIIETVSYTHLSRKSPASKMR